MSEGFDPYHKWLGIPPADQPPNHYRLLGISLFESDPDAIGNAADQRMAHVKSFQIGEREALSQKLLNELAVARVCLLDPEKKAAYDAQLREAAGEAGEQPGGGLDFLGSAAPAPSTRPPRPLRQKRKTPWLAIIGVVAGLAAVVLIAVLTAPKKDRGGDSLGANGRLSARGTPEGGKRARGPRLAAIQDQSLRRGETLRVPVSLADQGSPARKVKFALAASAPAGAKIGPDSGVLTWTPQKAGRYRLVVRALDPESDEPLDEKEFIAAVKDANRLPAIGDIGPKEARANETLSFAVPFADADVSRRRLTFQLRGETRGAKVSRDGVFAWTPMIEDAGETYQFTLRVGDERALPQFEEQTFAVAVSAGGVPRSQAGVTLPSGETLNTAELDARGVAVGVARTLTDAAWQKPLTAAMFTPTYDGVIPVFVDRKKFTGPVTALMWCSKNKANGATVTFWEGKDPVSLFKAGRDFDQVGLKQYINFKTGQLNGQAATWCADGKKEFLGHYAQNKRDGVCYLFQDGEVRLILESRHGGGEAVHLVSGGRVTKTFDDIDKAKSDETAGDMIQKVDQIESRLKAQEAVLQPYRNALRQRLAAELSVKHRADASARSRQRAAADANAWNNFIRQHAP
jgi:hypothetical protein